MANRDANGRFLPGTQIGVNTRWQKNVSGFRGGLRSRREFEDAFYGALMTQGNPDEAARLLWECARAKEPWALQLLLSKIAPSETKLKVTHQENRNHEFDLTKLTDSELATWINLAERASSATIDVTPARCIEAGEGPAQPAELHMPDEG